MGSFGLMHVIILGDYTIETSCGFDEINNLSVFSGLGEVVI